MIKNIDIINFRNFDNKTIEFRERVNIINAPNAFGKTNLLEALAFLAFGKSFKAKKESEVISYGKEITSILGRIESEGEIQILEVKITTGVNGWPKKKLIVNGVPRRLVDFAGILKVTLFLPQDLDLVSSAPVLRRKFLDQVLSLSDREYRRSLTAYEKAVKQRNKVLLKIREGGLSRENLIYWNYVLIKNGNYIMRKRYDLIEYLNAFKSNIKNNYNIRYNPSAVSEERFNKYKAEEIASGKTLVGPHRDDFIFLEEGRELDSYGSRGEQRMAVLWIKLGEFSYTEEKTNTKPVLLLDDIFSELDHAHRKIAAEAINNHQVIITSADEHNLVDIEDKNINIINL